MSGGRGRGGVKKCFLGLGKNGEELNSDKAVNLPEQFRKA
jgi:hypothetical protein